MQPVPQDLLKEYVQSQHFTSTTEIMEAMKEMFRDVIQTVMEVEMDEELGRERCERSGEPEGTPRNYRNGYTKKTVKTSWVRWTSRSPGTGTAPSSPRSSASMTGMRTGWRIRSWHCTPAA